MPWDVQKKKKKEQSCTGIKNFYRAKRNEIILLKRYLYPRVDCIITHNSQVMETTQMSRFTDEKIQKM